MSQNRDELHVGDTIAGRYIIKSCIGSGGMGAVYRAMPFHDPAQDVAIKIIRHRRALRTDDIMRFQKEAALMSLLHHQNIVCFHELGILGKDVSSNHSSQNHDADIGNGYYIVMEIVDGRDLKRSIQEASQKDLPYFFEIALQIASALDYTHGKNIIHQDIKPQNIVIGRNYRDQKGVHIKVLDFGVARLSDFTDSAGVETDETKSPEIAGTPMYMAPELSPYLEATIDHRLDLYSLGCVLYEVLTGRPPFQASTRDQLMEAHAQKAPDSIVAQRPDIPDVIENIVFKLLAKNPDDRYQTAFGLYSDLQRSRIQLFENRRAKVFFPLGLKDSFRAVSAQLPIVGRDEELKKIIQAYNSVSSDSGRSHMSVISASPGLGKTRLLSEFRNFLALNRCRFISVNFSRHETNLPYNALANGFNEYLIRLLKRHPQEAHQLKNKVTNILGATAHIVADKVQGLKPFIDPKISREPATTDYDSLDNEQLHQREFQTFAKAFADMTKCLATNNQPIAFIFDDLHWADTKSLTLVDQFFTHNNSQRFHLILSYREDYLDHHFSLQSGFSKSWRS